MFFNGRKGIAFWPLATCTKENELCEWKEKERKKIRKWWVTIRRLTVNLLNCAQWYDCELSESIDLITARVLCDSGEVVPVWRVFLTSIYTPFVAQRMMYCWLLLGETDSKKIDLFPSVSCTKTTPVFYDRNFNLNTDIMPRTRFLLVHTAGWYSALRERRDTFLSLKVFSIFYCLSI